MSCQGPHGHRSPRAGERVGAPGRPEEGQLRAQAGASGHGASVSSRQLEAMLTHTPRAAVWLTGDRIVTAGARCPACATIQPSAPSKGGSSSPVTAPASEASFWGKNKQQPPPPPTSPRAHPPGPWEADARSFPRLFQSRAPLPNLVNRTTTAFRGIAPPMRSAGLASGSLGTRCPFTAPRGEWVNGGSWPRNNDAHIPCPVAPAWVWAARENISPVCVALGP